MPWKLGRIALVCEGAFLIERIQNFHQISEGSVHHPEDIKNPHLGTHRLLHDPNLWQSLEPPLLKLSAPPLTHFEVPSKSLQSSEPVS